MRRLRLKICVLIAIPFVANSNICGTLFYGSAEPHVILTEPGVFSAGEKAWLRNETRTFFSKLKSLGWTSVTPESITFDKVSGDNDHVEASTTGKSPVINVSGVTLNLSDRTILYRELAYLTMTSLFKVPIDSHKSIIEGLADLLSALTSRLGYLGESRRAAGYSDVVLGQPMRDLRGVSDEDKSEKSNSYYADRFDTINQASADNLVNGSFGKVPTTDPYMAGLLMARTMYSLRSQANFYEVLAKTLRSFALELQDGLLTKWFYSGRQSFAKVLQDAMEKQGALSGKFYYERFLSVVDAYLFLAIFRMHAPEPLGKALDEEIKRRGGLPTLLRSLANYVQESKTTYSRKVLGREINEIISRPKELGLRKPEDMPLLTREIAERAIKQIQTQFGTSITLSWDDNGQRTGGSWHPTRGITLSAGPIPYSYEALIAMLLHEVGHAKRGSSEVAADEWMALEGLRLFRWSDNPSRHENVLRAIKACYELSALHAAGQGQSLNADIELSEEIKVWIFDYPIPQQRFDISLRKIETWAH